MIRVLLAEDMHMVRGALMALLNLEHDIEIVCEVENGDDIVPKALCHRPDVAVIDIDLPGIDGLTAAGLLRERMPGCNVLILTSMGRPGTLLRAMSVKVSGYILKDAPPSELASAVRRVNAGQRVVDSQLALAAWGGQKSPLTDRETEVLRLASKGAEPVEIASQLHLSTGTVRNYLTTITAKLNARNRLDAVLIAQESGWLL